MFKIKRKKKNRSSDESFKALMHNSDILSWILRGNLEEFKDMDIEEIKNCLTLGKNRKFVIGRDKEYVSRRHGRIELDTAFDVRIPGTNDRVSVIVGIEGVRLRRRIGIAQRSHGLNLNPCALSAYS